MHQIFKKVALILLTFLLTSLSCMENPAKQELLEKFWQDKPQLDQESTALVNQTLVCATHNKSLKGRRLKECLLNECPLTPSQALILLAASVKIDYPIGLQYGAYRYILHTREYPSWPEKLQLNSAMLEKYYNELYRQEYLIAGSDMWDREHFFSVAELHEHDCIHRENRESIGTSLQLDRRLNSLDGLDYYPQLESFKSWHGEIQTIALEDVANVTNLQDLVVHTHRLTAIPGIAQLTGLTKLALGVNCLDCTKAACISRLVRLTDLDLSSNRLTGLAILSPLTRLLTLRVSANYITELSESELKPLASLTCLEGYSNRQPNSGSKLHKIEGIYHLTHLKKLNLSSNGISHIDPVIERLSSLEDINFDDNSLATITPLVALPELRKLSVRHNKIITITPSEIDELKKRTKLEALSLGGNHIPDKTKQQLREALPDVRYLNFNHYMDY